MPMHWPDEVLGKLWADAHDNYPEGVTMRMPSKGAAISLAVALNSYRKRMKEYCEDDEDTLREIVLPMAKMAVVTEGSNVLIRARKKSPDITVVSNKTGEVIPHD